MTSGSGRTPNTVPLLVEALTRVARRKRTLGRFRSALALGTLVLSIPTLSLMMHALGSADQPLWPAYSALFALVCMLLAIVSVNANEKDLALVRTLHRLGDPRAIGPLVLALKVPGVDPRPIRMALGPLLEKLTPADAPLLDRDQRAALYAELYEEGWTNTLTLLKALPSIGDPAAIPHVERLIDRLDSAAYVSKQFRQAAVNCLEELRETASQNAQKQTLLRPASEAQDLLRPAAPSSIEEALLLRPIDGAEENRLEHG